MVCDDGEFSDGDCGELLNLYRRGERLGRGGQGQVFVLIDRGFQKWYAGKIFRSGRDANGEARLLSRLRSCPGVVSLKGFVKEREGGRWYGTVIMELCGPSLCDRLRKGGPLSEEEAARTIKKLAATLKEIHSMGIVHRDLKPENVFVKLGATAVHEVVIGDFGMATDVPGEMAQHCGTGKYMAPEVMAIMFGKSLSYTEAVDVWGLGLIALELLTGYRETIEFDFLRAGRFPDRGFASDEAEDLLRGMLAVDPRKRATLDRVLEHPWITKHCSGRKIEKTVATRRWRRCGDDRGKRLSGFGKRPAAAVR